MAEVGGSTLQLGHHWILLCIIQGRNAALGVSGKSLRHGIATNSCSALRNTVKKQLTTVAKGSVQVSWSNGGGARVSEVHRVATRASLTRVHAGEHQAQRRHGPVRRRHVDSVHAELDQRFTINAGQLLRQQEALEPAQNAMVDDGGGGVLAGRHHHATQLTGDTFNGDRCARCSVPLMGI